MSHTNDDISPQYIANVREFAKYFVRSVIDEALRQSTKTGWLVHCSDECYQLNPLNLKKVNSYIRWTPESAQNSKSVKQILNVQEELYDDNVLCKSVDISQRMSFVKEDLYTLPVDSVEDDCQNLGSFQSVNRHHKCLKPKAIHALNLLRSSHQKTFNDFKLFLFNLYSSNDVSPSKNLGSEHSVFTKYYSVETRNSDNLQDRKKRKKKDEDFTIAYYKSEKDLKMMRKCSRIKRSNLSNIGHSFCNMFKLHKTDKDESVSTSVSSFKNRSLPPLPSQMCSKVIDGRLSLPARSHICTCPCEKEEENHLQSATETNKSEAEHLEYDEGQYFGEVEYVNNSDCPDFAANIEKVKDYGWYWGPMSSEAAEKLLQNERDSSFIVRDSSDDRYIFSLTFKLNACIRHVRIEHGQGNFSFGNYTRFRSHTIVDFIENAVRHSRSGRYLFFLHRRPILGPMRVQLLYPVSRFKHVQSLQHMCRFVILKNIRRDLITSLQLPKSLIEYLSSQDYYTEQKF